MTLVRDRVLVLCGGTSSERLVSLESGKQVHQNLDRSRYEPLMAVLHEDGRVSTSWNEDGLADFSEDQGDRQDLLSAMIAWREGGVAVLFIALHGSPGEDGVIQAVAESAGLVYTGSGVIESATCMDKIVTRCLLRDLGFPVSTASVVYREIHRSQPEATVESLMSDAGPRLPCFLKVPRGGSSLGVVRATNRRELLEALDELTTVSDRVLVERAFSGVEISCGVLGNAGGELIALEPVEIRPRSEAFFSYREKYSGEAGAVELCPSEALPRTRLEEFQQRALTIHRAFGLRGMSRIDFIVGPEEYVVLEINTIPGLSLHSLLPKGARALGMEFPELLTRIIEAALH